MASSSTVSVPAGLLICLILTSCVSRPSGDCTANLVCAPASAGSVQVGVAGTGGIPDSRIGSGGASTPTVSRPLGSSAGFAGQTSVLGGGGAQSASAGAPGAISKAGSAGSAGDPGAAGSQSVAGAAGASQLPKPGVIVEPVVRVMTLKSIPVKVTVTRAGNNDRLIIAATGLPNGVVASDGAIPAGASDGQIVLQVNSSTLVGGPFVFSIAVTSSVDATWSASVPQSLFISQAPGQLDASLGASAMSIASMSDGGSDIARDVAVDSKGRIVMVGSGKTSTGADRAWAMRMTPAGKLDEAFGGGGKLYGFANSPSYAHKIAYVNDTLYVWAVGFANSNNVSFVRAFNETDLANNPQGAASRADFVFTNTEAPAALAPFQSGLVAFTAQTGIFTVIRADGKQDINFVPDSSVNASTIAVDDQGRVLFGRAQADAYVVGRLTSTGKIDTTFDLDGVSTVALPGGASSSKFVTLLPGKSVDALGLVQSTIGVTPNENELSLVGFSSSGVANSWSVRVGNGSATGCDAEATPDGKFLVLYSEVKANQASYRLVRLLSTGSTDSTFGANGTVDLGTALPGVTPRGMTYDSLGNRVVLYGDLPSGIVLTRIWL